MDCYSQDTIALAFSEKHADDLRYIPEAGWHRWNGTRWEKTPAVYVMEMSRVVCREFARKAGKDEDLSAARRLSIPARLRSHTTMVGVERLARGASINTGKS